MTTETLPFAASTCWRHARALWQRLARRTRRTARCLRLRESLALGEHRFVAVIECEHQRLLIGGTPSSLVLLAHLDSDPAEGSGWREATPAGRRPELRVEELRAKESQVEELGARENNENENDQERKRRAR